MLRSSKELHETTTCPLGIVKCPFEEFGCDIKQLRRADYDSHQAEGAARHAVLAASQLSVVTKRSATIEESVTKRLATLEQSFEKSSQLSVTWSFKYPRDGAYVADGDLTSKKVSMSLSGYGGYLLWLKASIPEAGKISIFIYASNSLPTTTWPPLFPLDVSGSSITLLHPSDSKKALKTTFPEGTAIPSSGLGMGRNTFATNVSRFADQEGNLRIDAVFSINQPKGPLSI
jgi:hypothetical protein